MCYGILSSPEGGAVVPRPCSGTAGRLAKGCFLLHTTSSGPHSQVPPTGFTHRFHPQVLPLGFTDRFHPQLLPTCITHRYSPKGVTHSITHRHHSHISPTGISCSPTIITRSFALQCLDSVSFNSFPLKYVDSGSTPLPNTVWASTFFICNMRLCERLLHVTVSVSRPVLFSHLP
jgi:hypothetical protein